jgi:hypothetical protein
VGLGRVALWCRCGFLDLWSGRVQIDAKSLGHAVQRLAIHIENLGSAFAIAVSGSQNVLQIATLYLFKRWKALK